MKVYVVAYTLIDDHELVYVASSLDKAISAITPWFEERAPSERYDKEKWEQRETKIWYYDADTFNLWIVEKELDQPTSGLPNG